MKFETEHGCVVSETATAYRNSEQIGRYAIAAAMMTSTRMMISFLLRKMGGSDGNQSLCTAGRKENASL